MFKRIATSLLAVSLISPACASAITREDIAHIPEEHHHWLLGSDIQISAANSFKSGWYSDGDTSCDPERVTNLYYLHLNLGDAKRNYLDDRDYLVERANDIDNPYHPLHRFLLHTFDQIVPLKLDESKYSEEITQDEKLAYTILCEASDPSLYMIRNIDWEGYEAPDVDLSYIDGSPGSGVGAWPVPGYDPSIPGYPKPSPIPTPTLGSSSGNSSPTPTPTSDPKGTPSPQPTHTRPVRDDESSKSDLGLAVGVSGAIAIIIAIIGALWNFPGGIMNQFRNIMAQFNVRIP